MLVFLSRLASSVPVPPLALAGTSAALESVARKVCTDEIIDELWPIEVELQPVIPTTVAMAVASRLARKIRCRVVMGFSGWFGLESRDQIRVASIEEISRLVCRTIRHRDLQRK